MINQQAKSCGRKLLLVTSVVACCCALLGTDRAVAQTKSDYVVGKEIFKRVWQFEAPMELARREGITDREYVKELKELAGDGLGPMHNATSCEACHVGGGGAGVDRNVTLLTLDPRSPAIKAASKLRNRRGEEDKALKALGSQIDQLFPAFIAGNGILSLDIVVHESSARSGYDKIRNSLAKGVSGGIDAQWFDREQRTSEAIAQTPVIAGRRGDLDYYLSQRNSPPLFGLGLIDRIPMKTLTGLAERMKKRSGGKITGRTGSGKFGWRAQTPTLRSFVAGACAGELGLQVDVPSSSPVSQPPDFADESYVSLGADLDEREFGFLVSYVRGLPMPRQNHDDVLGHPTWTTAGIRKGKQIFSAVGCNDCHVESVRPAQGLYSDLLLHDMGPHLQAPSPSSALASMTLPLPVFPRDERSFGSGPSISAYYGGGSTPRPYDLERPEEPQFPFGKVPEEELEPEIEANALWDTLQREWRTPPLWGLADSAPYLHDGRATTIDAAIRWHAGEAAESAEKYRSLDAKDRKLMLSFLKSLRAPVHAESSPNRSGEERWFDDQMLGHDSGSEEPNRLLTNILD